MGASKLWLSGLSHSFCVCVKVVQSCPTFCDTMDSSLPGSSVHGILQVRILERVKERKYKSLSCVRLFATPWTVTYQAPPSMRFSRQEYWSGLPLPSPRLTQCLLNISHVNNTCTIFGISATTCPIVYLLTFWGRLFTKWLPKIPSTPEHKCH